LLAAAVARNALRVWHEGRAEDDVPAAKIRPDFLLTHTRDAGASTIGAAIMVEVKLPGCLADASVQLCAYLRRRVYKLCCERHARGEPFDDIFALGAATDGHDILIVDTEDFKDLEDILGNLSHQRHLDEGAVLLQVRVSCSHQVREGLNCLWCVEVVCQTLMYGCLHTGKDVVKIKISLQRFLLGVLDVALSKGSLDSLEEL
jgi:hypothetical protein